MDRNYLQQRPQPTAATSPSSRRAWIEIVKADHINNKLVVALLAEGVDRNMDDMMCIVDGKKSPSSRRAWIEMKIEHLRDEFFGKSPSSRRAWIEISTPAQATRLAAVALLAEGVDRNYGFKADVWAAYGRPPRGGRG